MSAVQLFVFVEGTSDRNVYERLAARATTGTAIAFEVRAAQELPGMSGGKKACLDYYEYLRRQRKLVSDLNGKRTVAGFFLDKDIDDLLRTRKRSIHAIYTRYYDIEGHLYENADFVEAAAIASELTRAKVRTAIPNARAWRERAAMEWKEWVKLCIVARVTNANCACGFRLDSSINRLDFGGVDPALHAQMTIVLQAASGRSAVQFGALLARVARFVDREYDRGNQDRVFKGKWYTRFLIDEIQRVGSRNPPYNANVGPLLPKLLTTLVDYTGAWADVLVAPIERLIRLL